MNNTLDNPLVMKISKYKYSISLIISLLSAAVLALTNISYINIILFAILIFLISLFYLSRNKVIEGSSDSEKANSIIAGITNVLTANNIKSENYPNAEYIAQLTDIVNSISAKSGPGSTSTSTSNVNAPYIDTTPKTRNDKVLYAYSRVNIRESCNEFNHTECDSKDSCVWVNSITGNISRCERGDKSGPYPARNANGSLVDVDYNYYKIK